MSVFEYKAIDVNGKQSAGFIESDTEKSARQQLQSQQLTVLEVRQSRRKPSQIKSWLEPRLSIADTAIITRQLTSLLQAAMPIDEALKTIGNKVAKNTSERLLGKYALLLLKEKAWQNL
ncbi:hypothetical protein [Abyssogena phaseoliformis symbiont]|uniref:hypothetical protein n=1 Tax=Abyssogena phaseoliformis symbiont TaxID=596095 RepID=UPI00191556FF|nr:hypothetical protein [Abyssogena phaseoliformis symbiont]